MSSSDPQWKPNKRPRLQEQSYGEIQKQRRNLPIYAVKSELQEIFSSHDVVLFKGETACGKTTQIPQFILTGKFAGSLAIAVTQPRRVAAISIAERVAQEMGVELGGKVGYCVRFEDATSEATKIKFVTDGMLLRESISDPLLSSYSWVVLDEAHERTIHTDVLFGIVKAAQKARKKGGSVPLKVIIMSATIDEEKLSKYFDNAPIFYLPGREYKITVHYADDYVNDDYAIYAISTVFHIHNKNEEDGDILVFMTGAEEIESAVAYTHKVLRGTSVSGGKLLPCALYAALSSDLQRAALEPPPPMTRKVIYSTNIAETSLTIPGIKYVIDTGMVKSKSFSPASGLDLLKVQRVSKAQAEQRCGRAGRMGEGFCYRIYRTEQYDTFAEFPVPEIQRCNLGSVILQIVAVGISDIRTFDFLDRPSDENIDAAIEQLILLGAVKSVDGKIHLTESGKQMVNFPLDPRFSKMIITSRRLRCTDEILTIISMLSVESIFVTNQDTRENMVRHRDQFNNGEGDHIMLLNIYKAFRKAKSSSDWCNMHSVNYKSMAKAVAIRKQLSQICQRVGIMPCCCHDTETIRKCLCAGLFMNSAHVYKNDKGDKWTKIYKTIGGKQKVFIHPSSSLFQKRPSCCIYTDLVETSKCYMRNISTVDEDWLLDVAPDYFKKCGFKRFELLSV